MSDGKWDYYFKSHYRPLDREWSAKDLEKYKNWYTAWIPLIERSGEFVQGKVDAFEVGSGVGAIVSLLLDRGYQISGSDISRHMVAAASRLVSGTEFFYCDIEKRMPTTKRYTHILAFEVLEHLNKPEAALGHIRDSLQKGGYFLGSTPYPFSKNYKDPTHVHVHGPDTWRAMLRANGFGDIIMRPLSFLPFVWRINKKLNIIIPAYISFPWFVSTTFFSAKVS